MGYSMTSTVMNEAFGLDIPLFTVIVPIRPNSGSAATYAYDICVIGKWK